MINTCFLTKNRIFQDFITRDSEPSMKLVTVLIKTITNLWKEQKLAQPLGRASGKDSTILLLGCYFTKTLQHI